MGQSFRGGSTQCIQINTLEGGSTRIFPKIFKVVKIS